MSFTSILSDLKTRVESNIQEALKPIDGIANAGIPDPETELLRRKVKELLEGQQLAQKLASTEDKLREKIRSLDRLQPDKIQSDLNLKEKEISDLQLRLASLSADFTTYRGSHEGELANLRLEISEKDLLMNRLREEMKNMNISQETDNFQDSDWKRRYETALQAIGELEEKLEETEEEISVLRAELKRNFSWPYV